MKVLIGPNPMGLERALPDLKKQHPSVDFVHCPNQEDLPVAIADAEVYVGWLSRDLFLAAKQLKWIQSPSSGIDYYLKIAEIKDGPVLLTSASGTHATPLAESAFAMILSFTRGIRDSIVDQPKHVWRTRDLRSKCVVLSGTTIGIIGLGKIGRAIAVRAKAFEMKVIAVDVNTTNKPDFVNELWALNRLPDLLKQADYVVCTVPGTPTSKGLIGAKEIAMMKPSAMLLAISRGGVVDQDALIAAMKEKKIAAAAVDVSVPEPLPADSELWDLPNVLITPHISGGTQYESDYVIEILTENLGKYINCQLPLRNQIDKTLGF
jgi:phosphoglycerate dehydrogenase-like enzyme